MTEPLEDLIASGSQTVGPFFHFGLTANALMGQMAGPAAEGERLRLAIRVTDGAGEPLPDAMVELWHADASGRYPEPVRDPHSPRPPLVGYGRLGTAEDGWCEFETVRPGPTGDGPARQASHINVCVFARGLLRQVHTRLYFAGDPELAADPVLQLVPEARRPTLLARRDERTAGRWTFEIRLQGAEETVFFDL